LTKIMSAQSLYKALRAQKKLLAASTGRNTMAYLSFRLYSGTSAADTDEIVGLAKSELIPKVRGVRGLGRYVLVRSTMGQIGSLAVFSDKMASEEAKGMATDWVRGRPDFSDYKVAVSIQGEVGLAISGNTGDLKEGGYGIARLYRTKAPFEEINDAINKEGVGALQAIPGLARYTTVKAEDGRFAAFNLYESEEAARTSVEKAKQLRQSGGSMLGKVLPEDPEVIETEVLYTEYGR
jgi:hypothetical protein